MTDVWRDDEGRPLKVGDRITVSVPTGAYAGRPGPPVINPETGEPWVSVTRGRITEMRVDGKGQRVVRYVEFGSFNMKAAALAWVRKRYGETAQERRVGKLDVEAFAPATEKTPRRRARVKRKGVGRGR